MPANPLSPPRTDQLSSECLLAYFEDSWALSERLFASLTSDEAFYRQPDPLRNPLIFYFGHTAAFYLNKLIAAGLMPERTGEDARLDILFARGVDPHAADELDVAQPWPSVEAARAYRADAFAQVSTFIKTHSWGRAIGWDDPEWALLMGLEHDRIHFETSTMLFRQAPLEDLERPVDWVYAPVEQTHQPAGDARFEGGTVALGRPSGDVVGSYGWDNEYGQRVQPVSAFEIGRNLITNGEFLEFIAAGGYANRALWSEEAWQWLDSVGRAHPLFWRPDDTATGGFRYRAMFDELELPMSWPAEVCAHEALAYCHWVGDGARLPTEAEHHMAALNPSADCCADGLLDSTSGELGASHDHYNLNLRWGSPSPVGHCQTGPGAINDARGNVWQWLGDSWYAFEGFRPHPLYDDFSEPYFDEHHLLMAGGAWASTGTSASRWYRNWFRKHFYQHVGFRVARTL